MSGARTSLQAQAKPRPEDRLRYIADMSGELAALAGAIRQPMLTYFLNMARVEAEMQIAEHAQPERLAGGRRNTA